MWLRSIILFVFGGLWCQNDNLEMRKGTKKECVVNARHTPQTSRWTNHPSFVKQPTKYILFVEYSFIYIPYYMPYFRYLSTRCAASLPLAMARTTSEAPFCASPQRKTLSGISGCCGLRNPMARKHASHLMNSLSAAGSMMGLPPSGFGFHSMGCTHTPRSLPSLPTNSSVLMFQRRVHPSSWLDVVFSTRG